MKATICVVSAFSFLSLATLAHAADAAPGRVVFCGTVVKMTQDRCLGVQSAKAGDPTYTIIGTGEPPKVGESITGSGVVDPSPTTCTEGTVLHHVNWHLALCAAGDKLSN